MLARLLRLLTVLSLLAAGCVPDSDRPSRHGTGTLLNEPPPPLTRVDNQLVVLRDPIPWPFEANAGQGPTDAPLLLKHGGFSAAFTERGVRVQLLELSDDAASRPLPGADVRAGLPVKDAPPPRRAWVLEQELVGARSVEPVGTVPAEARMSYLKGDLWAPDLPSYHQVAYREPWPGIEIRYERDPLGLKSTYVVAPGADPMSIRLAWRGAERVALGEDGAVEIATPIGMLREAAPVAWQEGTDGARDPIPAHWTEGGPDADGDPAWGFELGAYDPARPLVIDPLLYGTYLGGGGADRAYGVAVDGSGRTIVVGTSDSSGLGRNGFGGAPGFDQSANGDYDGYVVRLNAAGTELEYGTFLGGSGYDNATGVAVDTGDRAVVTGYAGSRDFGFGGAPGFDQSSNGGDAFVVRLNAAGTALEYGTLLGGSAGASGGHVALHAGDRVIAAGFTSSADFNFGGAPGFDHSYNGGGDAYIVRLNPTGTALEYGTFLGGSGLDSATVSVDPSGRAIVAGYTASADFDFGGAPGFDQSYDGGGDAYAVRLSTTGTALEFATFLGGGGYDAASVAVDPSGRAVVAGYTNSPDFGFGGAPGFDQSYNGGYDAFVARLNIAGNGLEYATYLGGEGFDQAYGLALDSRGRALVTGSTNSSSFGFGQASGFDQSYNGGVDTFLVRLNVAGTRMEYGTFLGGSAQDDNGGVAADGSGRAIVVGRTNSSPQWFGGAPGFNQAYSAGQEDAFVLKDALAGATSPPQRARPADFDGDGRSDPAIRRLGAGPGGQALWWPRDVGGFPVPFPDVSGDIPVPADYDGDGKTDVALYRPSTGLWFGQQSGNLQRGPHLILGGQQGVIPIPCDYDGDGKADVAIFRPDDGLWFGQDALTGRTTLDSRMSIGRFGQPGDVPVVGDYDGDGACDVAVFRPTEGIWYGLRATGGTVVLDSRSTIGRFGEPGDIAVPGDYDGNGRTDLAYFRPSSGLWFGLRADGAIVLPGARYGSNGSIPVPADYDGDGRTDIAFYDPPTGRIIARPSGGGSSLVKDFGVAPGDVPVGKRPSLPGYPY